jgi:Uma2 family endonuclease
MSTTEILESLASAPPDVNGYEWPYEIVDGKRVELAPMSIYAVRIANRIVAALNRHCEAGDHGEAIVEGLFRLPLPRDGNRNRCPDAAFVSFQRWSKDRPMPVDGNSWDVVPDLAVEVVSPHDLAEELAEKIVDYFEAGVRLVWVVYPSIQTILIYRARHKIESVSSADELDGGAVLPNIRAPVASLFPRSDASA